MATKSASSRCTPVRQSRIEAEVLQANSPRCARNARRILRVALLGVCTSLAPQVADGAASAYWQQHVQYAIRVTLDRATHQLRGHEELLYTNASPDTLRAVWFHAYPNAYKDERSVFAREQRAHGKRDFLFSKPAERGWIEFDDWRCDGDSVRWAYKPGDETEVRIDLPHPLPPGGNARFAIEFRVQVPAMFSRLGRAGDHYEIAQWYPKIVVYDKRGWHPDGYHLDGEFYGDFGDFDVWITVPQTYTVAATGCLMGPADEIARLDALAASTADPQADGAKVASVPVAGSATKTLHYRAQRVHDFAWCADPRFHLLRGQAGAARIEAYFLPEHQRDWRNSVRYVHDTLDWYGQHFGAYPYPQMTLVDGIGYGGMEYPTLAVVQAQGPRFLRLFEAVVSHETGHQWFYGMVGTDEMNETWLDEGVVSYAELQFLESRYGRAGNLTAWPPGWGWLPRLDARWLGLAQYHWLADIGREEPILQPAYAFERGYYVLPYAKAGGVLMTLHGVLGDSLFAEVMRTYVREWSFRHPRTEDFLAVASRVGGCDLGPMFDGFMRSTGRCDYAIEKVRSMTADGGRQVEVDMRNRGAIPLPSVPVRLVTRDGRMQEQRTAAAQTQLVFATDAEVDHVEIDPEHDFLEFDHWNNRWPRSQRVFLGADQPSFFAIDHTVWPRIWYNEVDHVRYGLSLHRGSLQVRQPLWGVRLDYAPQTGRWAWGASYETRLPWNRGDATLTCETLDLEGYDQQRLALDVVVQRDRDAGRQATLEIAAFRNEIHDLRYYQPGDWQGGRTVGWQAKWWREARGARLRSGEELRLRQAFGGALGDFGYTKAEASAAAGWHMSRHVEIGMRTYAGQIWGAPPLQDRIGLAGDLDPDRRDAWVPVRRGTPVPLERWYVEGGPGLPGAAGVFHAGAHAADRTGSGLRLQLAYARSIFETTLFGDAGNVWPNWHGASLGNLRADAGFGVRLGPLRTLFPLWIDDPAAGDTRWQWRWLVGFDLARPIR